MNAIQQSVQRSNVNEQNYKVTDFPKSGFNLSHSSMFSGSLGRLIPAAHQHLLGNDVISGSNTARVTFDQLAVPIISPMNVHQYNFYVPFRGLMRTDLFEKVFKLSNRTTPSDVVLPSFTLADVVYSVSHLFDNSDLAITFSILSEFTTSDYEDHWEESYSALVSEWTSASPGSPFGNLRSCFYSVYIDTFDDLRAAVLPLFDTTPSSLAEFWEFLRLFLYTICDFFFGEGSLMDMLGYNIVRHADIDAYILDNIDGGTTTFNLYAFVNTIPMSELPLRAYHNIWSEYFRNVNLEPMNDDIDFRTWDLSARVSNVDYVWLLLLRPMQWDADLFTGAQIDDISRHIFAPVVSTASNLIQTGSNGISPADNPADPTVLQRNAVNYNLTYSDGGTARTVSMPLPTSVNDTILRLGTLSQQNAMKLDLQVLRDAHKLERFLMRNYLFGDEYRDYMRGHYGVTLTDLQMVRPQYLSGSIDAVDPRQEVANVGTAETMQGQRCATATASVSGADSFREFIQEFGLYINLFAVLPRAQYDPLTPQLLCLRRQDFPTPEFDGGVDEVSFTNEVARSSRSTTSDGFGHHPYAHAWRGRTNEVHGRFLSSMRECSFLRFYESLDFFNTPKLNWQFLHCHPYLGAFYDQILLDGQFYVEHEHNFAVERVLQVPAVEV